MSILRHMDQSSPLTPPYPILTSSLISVAMSVSWLPNIVIQSTNPVLFKQMPCAKEFSLHTQFLLLLSIVIVVSTSYPLVCLFPQHPVIIQLFSTRLVTPMSMRWLPLSILKSPQSANKIFLSTLNNQSTIYLEVNRPVIQLAVLLNHLQTLLETLIILHAPFFP